MRLNEAPSLVRRFHPSFSEERDRLGIFHSTFYATWYALSHSTLRLKDILFISKYRSLIRYLQKVMRYFLLIEYTWIILFYKKRFSEIFTSFRETISFI